LIPCAVLAISSSISAQEYFFDNGLYVGSDANATHVTRDKRISYASIGTDFLSLSRFDVKVKDWTGTPSLTIGYKLDDYNSLSLGGDWGRYFLHFAQKQPTRIRTDLAPVKSPDHFSPSQLLKPSLPI
jgi:hypothetical protein